MGVCIKIRYGKMKIHFIADTNILISYTKEMKIVQSFMDYNLEGSFTSEFTQKS